MQCYHVAGHDLDLLESFVHDCIQQLPKLQTTSDQQLPPRCAAYHAACSAMLKQALLVLEQLSPRLCRLAAQIWDLTSLNFFVLVQLAHACIDENEQLRAKSRNAEYYYDEMAAQHAVRQQRHEIELDKLRVECQKLRAELQTTRQKHNRAAVENSQLRQAISKLVDTHYPLSDSVRSDSGSGTGSGSGGDGASIVHVDFEADITVVGDAEERELYGVSSDELASIEKIHPIESLSQDLELLFEALVAQERYQVRTLNDLDRFINSSTVSLLWQYGSSEEEHRLMHKMMSAQSVACQTDAVESENRRRVNIVEDQGAAQSSGSGSGMTNDGSTADDNAEGGGVYAGGETGNATLVTKRQTIPASLRAQLQTRPKIQRVLEKDELNRLVLQMYLEKLEFDAVAVRARKPRIELHAFMKQFFVAKFGITPLADYHLMEVVKSCLYYHEHLEVERRRVRALGLPTASLVGAYPLSDSSSEQFAAADIRVALFSRVCELVQFELADVPIDGNLFACLTNAVVDLIGDVVELDVSVSSLEQVLALPAEDRWECSSELASALLSYHLGFAERHVLEDARARIAQLAAASNVSSAPRIKVDVFLAVFATAWLEYDQRLTRKLRDGFKRQLITLSPTGALAVGGSGSGSGDGKSAGAKVRVKHDEDDTSNSSGNSRYSETVASYVSASTSNAAPTESPVESLMLVCSMLPDEPLSPLDLDELRTAFEHLVDASRELTNAGRSGGGGGARRKSSAATLALKKGSAVLAAAPAAVCIGGVSEKEFVTAVVQILRVRRNVFGIRTHSRPPSTVPVRMSQLGASRQLVALIASHNHDGDLPLEMLKPGLERANGQQRCGRKASHSSSSSSSPSK